MQPLLNVKQIEKIHKVFLNRWSLLETYNVKFEELTKICCHLINKVPEEHIPHYVDEFYTKVGAMYDMVDSLEFGKMRTETQKILHQKYISHSMRGAFLATALKGEKDIPLSYCSHEGLVTHIKTAKLNIEQNTEDMNIFEVKDQLDQIEVIENSISTVAIECDRFRANLIKTTRDALTSAIKTSLGKRFCLDGKQYYMDGNFGHIEGYKCEYYRKGSGKNQQVLYKRFMYTMLQTAHENKRDLYLEIQNLVVLCPLEYSHDVLLADYNATLEALEVTRLASVKKLEEETERKRLASISSKLIVEAQRKQDALITDPEVIQQLENEKKALHKACRRMTSGEIQPGDSSSSESELDEGDVEATHTRHNYLLEQQTEPQSDLSLLMAVNVDTANSAETAEISVASPLPTDKQAHSSKHDSRRSSSSSSRSVGESSLLHSKNDGGSLLGEGKKKTHTAANEQARKSHQSKSSSTKRKYDANHVAKLGESSSEDSAVTTEDEAVPKCQQDRRSSSSSRKNEKSDRREHHQHSRSGSKRSSSSSKTHHRTEKNSGSSFLLSDDNQRSTVSFALTDGLAHNQTLVEATEGLSLVSKPKRRKDKKVSSSKTAQEQFGEDDPNLPDWDGHPENNSLLHNVDEDLTYIRRSESDEEMEFDSHDNGNSAAWNAISKPVSSKKRKRSSNPDKVALKMAENRAASIKKHEKELEIKKCRDEQVFQRRVLEANSRVESVNEDGGAPRKRRVTSGLSAAFENFYGDNLAINNCSKTDGDLIIGCAALVLGDENRETDNSAESDMVLIESFRKLSGDAADAMLKDKLMKHLQVDIFKEITFERLVTEYAVAKRQACGAKDDEIVDIDWFEVFDEFRVILKERLNHNSKSILVKIHNAIDHDENIPRKHEAKDSFSASMTAFIRHGVRTINSVINKTIHKIGAHFDSMNFSDAVPKYATYSAKNKGYAFAFKASLYNLMGAESVAAAAESGGDLLGIDPLLSAIMQTNNQEQHMTDIIRYKLVKKTLYIESPENYGALHKYLEKKTKKDITAVNIDRSDTGSSSMSIAAASNSEINESHMSSLNRLTNAASSSDQDDVDEASCTPISSLNKQLFSPSTDERSYSNELPTSGLNNGSCPSTRLPPSQTVAQALDGAEFLEMTPSPPKSLWGQATQGMRDLLELLLTEVKGQDDHLFLKFNTKHNVRNIRNLQLIKFFENHPDLDDNAMYDMFCESPFLASISSAMFIPFKLADQYNIKGDGYCFYRSIFMLWLRAQSDYTLTAAQLADMDDLLKTDDEDVLNEDGMRAQFQPFLDRIEALFTDQIAKAKVATANSIPGLMNGRETLDYKTVGGAYSLSDAFQVLQHQHNWLLHKTVHFFVADHPSEETLIHPRRSRLNLSKGDSDSEFPLTEVYERLVKGTSVQEDIVYLEQVTTRLQTKLSSSNVVVVDSDSDSTIDKEGLKVANLKQTYVQTPQGASPAEKQYFSTLNDQVAIRELENVLLRTQLEGLKDMIARNSAAVKDPVFIDCDE